MAAKLSSKVPSLMPLNSLTQNKQTGLCLWYVFHFSPSHDTRRFVGVMIRVVVLGDVVSLFTVYLSGSNVFNDAGAVLCQMESF